MEQQHWSIRGTETYRNAMRHKIFNLERVKGKKM